MTKHRLCRNCGKIHRKSAGRGKSKRGDTKNTWQLMDKNSKCGGFKAI